MNIFAQASQQKLRFQTSRGLLHVESLWDIPLQANSGFDLETLADTIEADIGSIPKRSRVTKRKNVNPELKLKLAILDYIIEAKLEEIDAATEATATKDRRIKLTQALADQEAEKLKQMSSEDIKKELASL